MDRCNAAYFVLFGVLAFSVYFADDNHEALAVCCFPYETIFYVDPIVGNLVVEGQLRNDSYKSEPFGKVNYQFQFYDSERNVLFERDLQLTDGHPIGGEFVIPPGVALPFHIVIDDVGEELIQQVRHVSSGGNNNIEYFSWKPADLQIVLDEMQKIETLHDSDNQETFHKWKIVGTITNTHLEKVHNVYVVASILDADDNFLGTAGYSDDENDIQPLSLDAFETKNFVIHSVLSSKIVPEDVFLYGESDESSAVYRNYQPVILKNIIDFDGRYVTDPQKPIMISANVTNISRVDLDLNWIVQIKKSPASVLEGDGTKYPQSSVILVEKIPISVEGQKSILFEFSWKPHSGGVYFYEMYLWDADNIPVSHPFTGNFFSQGEMFVHPSYYTIKNQLASGKSFDKLVCREGLELAHRTSNANFVCIKSESVPKLLERGWLTLG